jgi:hypothetical protein
VSDTGPRTTPGGRRSLRTPSTRWRRERVCRPREGITMKPLPAKRDLALSYRTSLIVVALSWPSSPPRASCSAHCGSPVVDLSSACSSTSLWSRSAHSPLSALCRASMERKFGDGSPVTLPGLGSGLTWLAGNWSIGIRRLEKIAQGSALRPRYAARMEGRVWSGLVGA